jgi:hypothetical protein
MPSSKFLKIDSHLIELVFKHTHSVFLKTRF